MNATRPLLITPENEMQECFHQWKQHWAECVTFEGTLDKIKYQIDTQCSFVSIALIRARMPNKYITPDEHHPDTIGRPLKRSKSSSNLQANVG